MANKATYSYQKGGASKACPSACEIPNLQAANENAAIENNNYRESDGSSGCQGCALFDVSKRMQNCNDKESGVGYCWKNYFKCKVGMTCDSVEEGGPIEDDSASYAMQAKYVEEALTDEPVATANAIEPPIPGVEPQSPEGARNIPQPMQQSPQQMIPPAPPQSMEGIPPVYQYGGLHDFIYQDGNETSQDPFGPNAEVWGSEDFYQKYPGLGSAQNISNEQYQGPQRKKVPRAEPYTSRFAGMGDTGVLDLFSAIAGTVDSFKKENYINTDPRSYERKKWTNTTDEDMYVNPETGDLMNEDQKTQYYMGQFLDQRHQAAPELFGSNTFNEETGQWEIDEGTQGKGDLIDSLNPDADYLGFRMKDIDPDSQEFKDDPYWLENKLVQDPEGNYTNQDGTTYSAERFEGLDQVDNPMFTATDDVPYSQYNLPEQRYGGNTENVLKRFMAQVGGEEERKKTIQPYEYQRRFNPRGQMDVQQPISHYQDGGDSKDNEIDALLKRKIEDAQIKSRGSLDQRFPVIHDPFSDSIRTRRYLDKTKEFQAANDSLMNENMIRANEIVNPALREEMINKIQSGEFPNYRSKFVNPPVEGAHLVEFPDGTTNLNPSPKYKEIADQYRYQTGGGNLYTSQTENPPDQQEPYLEQEREYTQGAWGGWGYGNPEHGPLDYEPQIQPGTGGGNNNDNPNDANNINDDQNIINEDVDGTDDVNDIPGGKRTTEEWATDTYNKARRFMDSKGVQTFDKASAGIVNIAKPLNRMLEMRKERKRREGMRRWNLADNQFTVASDEDNRGDTDINTGARFQNKRVRSRQGKYGTELNRFIYQDGNEVAWKDFPYEYHSKEDLDSLNRVYPDLNALPGDTLTEGLVINPDFPGYVYEQNPMGEASSWYLEQYPEGFWDMSPEEQLEMEERIKLLPTLDPRNDYSPTDKATIRKYENDKLKSKIVGYDVNSYDNSAPVDNTYVASNLSYNFTEEPEVLGTGDYTLSEDYYRLKEEEKAIQDHYNINPELSGWIKDPIKNWDQLPVVNMFTDPEYSEENQGLCPKGYTRQPDGSCQQNIKWRQNEDGEWNYSHIQDDIDDERRSLVNKIDPRPPLSTEALRDRSFGLLDLVSVSSKDNILGFGTENILGDGVLNEIIDFAEWGYNPAKFPAYMIEEAGMSIADAIDSGSPIPVINAGAEGYAWYKGFQYLTKGLGWTKDAAKTFLRNPRNLQGFGSSAGSRVLPMLGAYYGIIEPGVESAIDLGYETLRKDDKFREMDDNFQSSDPEKQKQGYNQLFQGFGFRGFQQGGGLEADYNFINAGGCKGGGCAGNPYLDSGASAFVGVEGTDLDNALLQGGLKSHVGYTGRSGLGLNLSGEAGAQTNLMNATEGNISPEAFYKGKLTAGYTGSPIIMGNAEYQGANIGGYGEYDSNSGVNLGLQGGYGPVSIKGGYNVDTGSPFIGAGLNLKFQDGDEYDPMDPFSPRNMRINDMILQHDPNFVIPFNPGTNDHIPPDVLDRLKDKFIFTEPQGPGVLPVDTVPTNIRQQVLQDGGRTQQLRNRQYDDIDTTIDLDESTIQELMAAGAEIEFI